MKHFLISALICIGSYAQAQPNVKYTVHREDATTKNQSDWYYGKSTEGHFSVEVPFPFNDLTTRRIRVADTTLSYGIHAVGGKQISKTKYEEIASFSAEKHTNNFSNFNELLKDLSAPNTTATNVIQTQDETSKSIYYEEKEGDHYVYMKYIYTDDILYVLVVQCPISKKKLIETTYKDRFFSSFKIEGN